MALKIFLPCFITLIKFFVGDKSSNSRPTEHDVQWRLFFRHMLIKLNTGVKYRWKELLYFLNNRWLTFQYVRYIHTYIYRKINERTSKHACGPTNYVGNILLTYFENRAWVRVIDPAVQVFTLMWLLRRRIWLQNTCKHTHSLCAAEWKVTVLRPKKEAPWTISASLPSSVRLSPALRFYFFFFFFYSR